MSHIVVSISNFEFAESVTAFFKLANSMSVVASMSEAGLATGLRLHWMAISRVIFYIHWTLVYQHAPQGIGGKAFSASPSFPSHQALLR